MPIVTVWDNDDKTVLRHVYEGAWTWNDFKANLVRCREILNSINHSVDLIIDTRNGRTLPDGAVGGLGVLRMSTHQNLGKTVLVGTNLFISRLYNAFHRAYCDNEHGLALAPTLELARTMLFDQNLYVIGLGADDLLAVRSA
jgi:hypothetical protein